MKFSNHRYGPQERNSADLFLPPTLSSQTPVILIHGGGWEAMSKETMLPIAALVTASGRAAFCINYRLLPDAPWPACKLDCLRAARFVLGGGLAGSIPVPERLLICGASAGGHLAMLTGLALGSSLCAGIISMAGPSRVDPRDDSPNSAICSPGFPEKFFGFAHPPSCDDLAGASPSALVRPGAPQLVCIQSTNDLLVPPAHSEEAVLAWRNVQADADVQYFPGQGTLHGFWTNDDVNTRELVPEVRSLLQQLLSKMP